MGGGKDNGSTAEAQTSTKQTVAEDSTVPF